MQAAQLDAIALEHLQGIDALLEALAQAGELPDDEGVTGAHKGDGFGQSRSCGFDAAGFVLSEDPICRHSRHSARPEGTRKP